MFCRIILLLILISLSQVTNGQQHNRVYLHPYSNALALTLEGGITISDTDFRSTKVDYLGNGAVEYFFNSNKKGTFGLKIIGGISYIGGKDGVVSDKSEYDDLTILKTLVYNLGAGYSYTYDINSIITAYIAANISYIKFDPRGENNVKIKQSNNELSRNDIKYTGEVGVRIFVDKNISLNLLGTANFMLNDNLDGVWLNDNNDKYYSINAGISYYFTGARDSDADGVEDSEDFCPNTPSYVIVDDFGCPLDTDQDGVMDQKDLCPDTGFGTIVDSNGCPIDLDEDGIPDSIDQCLYTPKGMAVDKNGCPLDMDKDGVPDSLDNCLYTPIGVEVDKFGCPVVKKDSTFNETVISNFDFNSTELPNSAFTELDKLLSYMKANPSLSWSIEGHADIVSVSGEENYKISLERAKSVQNYLKLNGVDEKKLRVLGFSHFMPISNENTISGRSLNRRVEIIKLN